MISIPVSKIFIGYAEAKKLLRAMGMMFDEDLQKARSLKNEDFSFEFKKNSLTNDYKNIYSTARKNLDYNLLLEDDGAIFQFGFQRDGTDTITDIRYAYYEAPTKIISYEEFLLREGYDIMDCGDVFYEYYDQHKMEEAFKDSAISIRYDYSYNQYDEIKHPISHLHIGQENEIRIPLSGIMMPKSFVGFILRHVYWEKWKVKIDDPEFKDLYLTSKQLNLDLHTDYFNRDEKLDFYII